MNIVFKKIWIFLIQIIPLTLIYALFSLIGSILPVLSSTRKNHFPTKPHNSSIQSKKVTGLEMAANQWNTGSKTKQTINEDLENPKLSSTNNTHNNDLNLSSHPNEEVNVQIIPSNSNNGRSRWDAMRLKKHFAVQTTVMLKENEPSFAGAFAASTELRTVKKSPFSFLPFKWGKALFSRTEFMLVKSAILVFIKCIPQRAFNVTETTMPAIENEPQYFGEQY
eukprot:gb/GECH01012900.1/.p1 GENE.gb/GECH01012900.1/~~gb/GECH01012900.1/.p1  ORF type:complete len:223 (+),score=29.04 gb/GECH01012900.1/:1-669(+)